MMIVDMATTTATTMMMMIMMTATTMMMIVEMATTTVTTMMMITMVVMRAEMATTPAMVYTLLLAASLSGRWRTARRVSIVFPVMTMRTRWLSFQCFT